MRAIITITFSPCIDKSTSVPFMVPDKKLHCNEPTLEPGGGGINVARALKKLETAATAVFPSGGYTGKYFNHLLEADGIPAVIIESAQETRENIIILNESENRQYRFGMPGAFLSEREWQSCLEAVERMDDVGFIVASGSLPPGVPDTIYADLARMAKNKEAKFIVDTAGKALRHAVEEGVYLLKPNLGELSVLVGKPSLLAEEAASAARAIIAKGKCEVMVVSMGADGALLATKESTATIVPPHVIKKSTVGAGDSMVAGIVHYLSLGKSLVEAVQYGVACGTAATMNPGTALCKKEDADRLFSLINEQGMTLSENPSL